MQAMTDRALSFATADCTEVHVASGHFGSTRFSSNVITQNLVETDQSVVISSAFDNKVGTAQANDLSEDTLRELVARAEAIAKASEPDTEYVPPVGPQHYEEIPAFSEATSAFSPDDRARAVQAATSQAVRRNGGMRMAGSCASGSSVSAMANSNGAFAYHQSSNYAFTVTAIGEDSSGWAEQSGTDVAELDADAVAARAYEKARLAAAPQEIEAKPYTTILEPAAACEFLQFMMWNMDAKEADEGRSAFAGKEGTSIGVPAIRISTDPTNRDCPGRPWTSGGEPAPKVTWIENGTLGTLAYSRFWAKKKGRPFTGRSTNFVLDGQGHSLDDMIASVDEGLLVTRFWYIRSVDPMTLLHTGMTRDGLFLIENGKVKCGVKHMRFNESPLRMLSQVEMLGRPTPVSMHGRAIVPPIKVAQFQFTSGTTF